MTKLNVRFPTDAYLARIGFGERAPELADHDSAAIDAVARAQHRVIPFENLDIHRGLVVDVSPGAIIDKLITERRGGICYELNGVLLLALRELGVQAQPIGAQVRTEAGVGLPLGHMAIVVGSGSVRHLVDVGFGGEMVTAEVDLDDPLTWEIASDGGGYVLDGVPRELGEFAGMARWHSTDASSRFTGSVICTRDDGGSRHTLTSRRGEAGYRLVTTDADGTRVSEPVTMRESIPLLRRLFGIELDEPVAARDDFTHAKFQGVGNGSPR
ncbi:arylamine N-acetyltransferase family protein [Gordonia jacobaea]|uniref:arylamine N-acetyltransferase family protein n=1 Tax=Gordonia jacobaea TaxID=122202 RepID=UPI003D71B68A